MKRVIPLQIPKQLELLCELLETTPEEVLQGFINDLSLEVHYSNGSDERRMAVAYFLRCNYGYHLYELSVEVKAERTVKYGAGAPFFYALRRICIVERIFIFFFQLKIKNLLL